MLHLLVVRYTACSQQPAMPCHAMPCHAMPCHAMPVVVSGSSGLHELIWIQRYKANMYCLSTTLVLYCTDLVRGRCLLAAHHKKHTVTLRQKLGDRKLGGRKNPLPSKVKSAPPLPPPPGGPPYRSVADKSYRGRSC